jgi:hypothetical protein
MISQDANILESPPKDFEPAHNEPVNELPVKKEHAKVAKPTPEDGKDLVDQQLQEMQDQIDDRDPKLYVDVNIGKSGVERIVVYDGDTAESLAEEFCQKHNLKAEMKEKLVLLLEAQIAGVLPKIDEDEDADDSEEDRKQKK